MKLIPAQAFADHVVRELRPYCDKIEIAGSIRRQRPEVGDVDIVCIPHGLEGREHLISRCRQKGNLVRHGLQYVEFLYVVPSLGTVQLDLWFAHAGKMDLFTTTPSNWGMLLLARTGSKEHNVKLASLAKAKGFTFSPHEGLKRGDAIVASRTEEEIFAVLGLHFIAPEGRG